MVRITHATRVLLAHDPHDSFVRDLYVSFVDIKWLARLIHAFIHYEVFELLVYQIQ